MIDAALFFNKESSLKQPNSRAQTLCASAE